MSSELQEATVANESIEYVVRRSEEATEPRIDVGIHEITVVLPKESDVDAEELLRENGPWVAAKKRKYDRYREQAPDRTFEEGATFPYLGDRYEVVVERRPLAVAEGGELRLPEHQVEQTSVKRTIEAFYRRKARDVFEERAQQFAEEMDVSYDEIEIRNQRTKWGSCSTTGTLGFNWRLMMAPSSIVDYIVVHELAHLREASHSDEFWQIVAEYDPEYDEHATWLAENSAKLIFTKEDL